MTKTNTNLYWADNIRFVATIFVIIIHVTAPVVENYSRINYNYWKIANLIDSLCRCSVPLFVMLSGAFLLGKEETTALFFRKRTKKILLPFLVWSCVYLGMSYVSTFIFNSSTNNNLVEWIVIKITHGTSYHLWYIYMIIGLYLMIPFLVKMIKSLQRKDYLLFFFIWLLTLLLHWPIVASFLPNFDFTFFTGYIGYLLLGYFLSTINLKFLNLKTGISMAVLGWIMTFLLTYFSTAEDHKLVEIYYEYLTPNVALTAIGVFIIFKNLKPENILFNKLSNLISQYSYGIYLNHVLILTFLYRIGISWKFINPLIGIFLTFFTCLIISIIIVWLTEILRLRKYLG